MQENLENMQNLDTQQINENVTSSSSDVSLSDVDQSQLQSNEAGE